MGPHNSILTRLFSAFEEDVQRRRIGKGGKDVMRKRKRKNEMVSRKNTFFFLKHPFTRGSLPSPPVLFVSACFFCSSSPHADNPNLLCGWEICLFAASPSRAGFAWPSCWLCSHSPKRPDIDLSWVCEGGREAVAFRTLIHLLSQT